MVNTVKWKKIKGARQEQAPSVLSQLMHAPSHLVALSGGGLTPSANSANI